MGYHPELLTPETMELLANSKSNIKKNKNDENVSHLEISEVVLKHCNVVNNSFQQNSRVLISFVPNTRFSKIFNISPENFIF